MPTFIQVINRREFEVVGIADAPQRIMGALFGDTSNYFRMVAKDRKQFDVEFSLRAFDEEIKALHMLASTPIPGGADDRRVCIEVQSGANVPLSNNQLIAIVCPSIYLDEPEFLSHVENIWKAEPLSYNLQPLYYSAYMSEIYNKILMLYKQRGYL